MIIDSYMENGFYTADSVIEELADITPVDYSSCATIDEACMTAYLETVSEYNIFENALRDAEISYVQENGTTPIYEAVNIKELAGQAIGHVKAWVAKMMGILDRFMKEVAAKIATARTKIFKGNQEKFDKGSWTSDMEYDDYDYVEAVTGSGNIIDAPLIDATQIFEDAADYKNTGKVGAHVISLLHRDYNLSTDGGINVTDIRDSNLKKVTINAAYVSKMAPIQVINGGFKNGLATVKKEKQKINKSASNTIKAIKRAASGKEKDEKKVYNQTVKAVGFVNSTNNILISAKLSLLTGYLNQAYKIAGMMYRSGRKIEKEAKKNKSNAQKKDEAVNAAARIVGF